MREMSPALRDLLREKAVVEGMQQEAERRATEAVAAYAEASEEELAAARRFKREAATFKLSAPYKTTTEKQWAADADERLNDLQAAWDVLVTKRREMEAAKDLALRVVSAIKEQYEPVTAAIHAYNRELKVELELAGRAT